MKYDSRFLVRIECMTYNHESYIGDAMAGFVMQDTGFPFVAVIIDDASTDKTGETILRFMDEFFTMNDPIVTRTNENDYGRLLFAQHKTNKNCFFAVILLKENHYSRKKSKSAYYQEWSSTKYIASCEGDDYWTDPLKLQTQVDFLEANPDFVVCSHNFTRYYQDSLSYEDRSYYSYLFSEESPSTYYEYDLDTYFDRWWTQPLTCMYRNGDYLKQIPYSSYQFFRDDIFYYYVLKKGKGVLFKESMGVYRVHGGGVWSRESLLRQYDRGASNAFNIYLVEGDIRAFKRINREELRILTTLFNLHSYGAVVKRLRSFKKIAPNNQYKQVLRDFGCWLKNKTKRITKRAFHLGTE